MDGLALGRVLAVHPESHCIDVYMIADGRRLTGVRAISTSASSNTGLNDLAAPSIQDSQDPKQPLGQREIMAVIAYVSGLPVCMGYLYPNVAEMMFSDMERKIDRHASDFYSTTDSAGNTEFYHPSGAYIRVATDPGHEDLTGRDFDRKWAIRRNTGQQIYVSIHSSDAETYIEIDPNGKVTVNARTEVMVTAGEEISLNAPQVTIDAATTHCTGALIVDGSLTHGGPPCCCC